MNELKKYLFDCYNGFADKRIKNLDNGKIFIVDDRGPRDFNAKKEFFHWFCAIHIEVINNDSVKVIFSEKTNLLNTAQIDNEINITRENINQLNVIADKIQNIVAKGKRYSEPSYKHICPRTAKSLRVLADNLIKFWK